MSEIAPQVDASVFMPANQLLLQSSLTTVARQFSQNQLMVEMFLDEQDPSMTTMPTSIAGRDEGTPAASQFDAAWKARQIGAEMLCAYAAGLQRHAHEGLLMAYGEDDEDAVSRESWGATWARFRDVLRHTEGGIVVVYVADMFDDLVRQQYPATYDSADVFRGVEARADVSAYTFYEVMEPHLTHSVTRRPDRAVGH